MLSKILIPTPFALGLLILAAGCADNPVAPFAPDTGDEALVSASKTDFVEDIWVADLDSEPPYENCATGATMQNHGSLEIHDLYKITPSGNVVISSWVDYQALGPVTLENLDNGDIWTLVTGKNPATYVFKENGFFMLAYQWTELYKMGNQTLHIHLKGHIQIDPDGTVKIDRESYTCR